MERQAADQGQRQMAGLAEVTKHRQQQQCEGHHKLAPLLPPGQSGEAPAASRADDGSRERSRAGNPRLAKAPEYGVDIAIGFAEI